MRNIQAIFGHIFILAMKNILIPTDFSQNARNALRYALAYFPETAVNFYILHIEHFENNNLEGQENFTLTLSPKTLSETQKSLQKEIDFCKKKSTNPLHNFIPLISDKSLVKAIRNCVKENEIDYIVIGTRGASERKCKNIGSVSYEIISKVKCPTIVVPKKAIYKNFKNIALPTDYNHWDKNKMYINLYETLFLKKAKLHILQIQNKNQSLTNIQENSKSFLTDLIKKINYSLYSIPNHKIEKKLQTYIDKVDINMIVIVGRNVNYVHRLLFQPKSEDIPYRLNTPFLILHD